MGGRLQMSETERQRLGPLRRVVDGDLTLSAATVMMGISYRQAVRVLKRYRQEGDAGLVHRACGRASARATDPAYKEAVLDLVRAEYKDFGPTLASEKLCERHGMAVNRETLRRWLVAAGERPVRRSKQKHRTWRPRKACFGEMVQMDGSPHAWFEERGANCFLMNLVDDATGKSEALFKPEEPTWAAMEFLERGVRRYGIPLSIYVDRKNVYVTDREQTRQEQLEAMPALTQFGRACHKLGIRIIEAHSPQAKGRVERKHGVFQDRLIKDMRLDGISHIEHANQYLPAWLDMNNAQFAKVARSPVDMHRPVPQGLDLHTVFCLEEERSVAMDYTVRYMNRWLQISAQKDLLAPRCRVRVQEWRDGTLHLFVKESELNCRLLDARPQTPRPQLQTTKEKSSQPASVPAQDHPWRRSSKPSGDYINLRYMPELVNQLADQYLGPPNLTP